MSGAADDRKVRSLADLPQAIEPSRDLWASIEARLEPRGAARRAGASSPLARGAPLRWLAAAAMVASLAVGVWIGRSVIPNAGQTAATGITKNVTPPPGGSTFADATYIKDPRYQREHAALLKSLGARLAALPPPARAKVTASLEAINRAKHDLESALGKDPGNALLEELLVNTYQDEMRVLTDLHEAGAAGQGI